MRTIPTKDELTVCFAHVAYRMAERFALRGTGISHFRVGSLDELTARIGEADVLSVSMMWRNELIARAPKLAFIQSISAGTDQYDRARSGGRYPGRERARRQRQRGVRARNGADPRADAPAPHRPRQSGEAPLARHDRRLSRREDELGGKTLMIVGLGRIGSRLARLAQAFGMRVIAVKRDPRRARRRRRGGGAGPPARAAAGGRRRRAHLPAHARDRAVIDARALAAMKPSAFLVNVARGRVVDEPALVAALTEARIAGAGIDCTVEEPLPAASPLWGCGNALVTPHTAGETRRYEDNVIDLLVENLDRLWRGETTLRNQVV